MSVSDLAARQVDDPGAGVELVGDPVVRDPKAIVREEGVSEEMWGRFGRRRPVEVLLRMGRVVAHGAGEDELAVLLDVEARAVLNRRVNAVDLVSVLPVVDDDHGVVDRVLHVGQRVENREVAPGDPAAALRGERSPRRAGARREVAHRHPAGAAVRVGNSVARHVDRG